MDVQLSRVLLTNIVYIKRRTPYACTDPAGSAKAHFDPVDPTDFSVCRPLGMDKARLVWHVASDLC